MRPDPNEMPRLPKNPVTMSPEWRDLLRRRTLPFMNHGGLQRPLAFVLEEVYLQGMRDALQAVESLNEEKPTCCS